MSVKCPKCHHENSEDSIYCGKCTTPLKLPEEIDVTETIETPKEELTTGVTFAGRYQIIEELGKGGMGKVYKVHDTEIREKVALKLLKSEISADEKTIERFRNEIKLARKIAHRNVCKMFDLGEEKGTRFITMEYVEGEDLKSMIRMMGLLSRGKAISIAKQVCEGLAEAHGFGIVHRDLKPSNIMIDKFGNAKIMDFGIARSLRAKGITGTGVMIGTPEYMSPEQVEGKETDQRTDIYSLGIILYEMVTGQTPFDGETAFSIALKHKSEIPRDPREFNAQIGDDLSILILQCLEKDRDKRYQRVEDLISDFTKIEESIPTTERVVPKRQPLTAREITVKFSLKKFIVPSVVVLALVILITVSVFLIKKLPSGKPLPLPPSHKQLTFTGNASYPAISPDGKFIAYVNRESYEEQNVMVQDLIGGQSIEIFSGLNCVNLKWSPDGSELVIHDREKGAVVLPRLGGTPLQLGGAANIAWSHDGSKLAKIFTAVKKIIIQNKTTGQTTSISLEGTFTFIKDVDWSPAGNLLLFLTIDDEERYAIWTITPDGKIQNKIHEDEAPLFSPRWSSEGNTIYYLRSKEQVKEL
ncbi:MAG: protein kinase, partial [Deltaproteobacteria bacterium]|nr:protein kinase [Deltaproteobacteria bacterium]